MNKTLNINLGGLIFHIDDDAFKLLERYLSALKTQFASVEDGAEIVKDVELRLAELFRERSSASKEVVSRSDVEEVIAVLGEPEDFLDPEENPSAKASQSAAPGSQSRFSGAKRVFRHPDQRILGGVAAGFAAYFNIDAVWLRLLFLLLLFTGFGFPLYIILWIVIPRARTTAEKLQMRGEPVTVENIERAIRHEASEINSSYRRWRRQNNSSGFLGDFGNFLLDLFRLLFRFAFKILGIILLLVGVLLLFALIAGLFTGSIEIANEATVYTVNEGLSFLRNLTMDENQYQTLITGAVLLLVAPLFLLIYFGIRLLFQVEPLKRSVRNGLVLLALLGLIITASTATRLGLQFKEESTYSYETVLPASSQRRLQILEDETYRRYADTDFEAFWLPVGDSAVLRNVRLDIRASKKGETYLLTEVEARGPDRRKALKNARAIRYQAEWSEEQIAFPLYYALPEEGQFRGQSVDLTLYLTEGDTVFLAPGTEELIYDIQNVENYWDWDMIGHHWTMTPEGLQCADCLEAETDGQEEDSPADTADFRAV